MINRIISNRLRKVFTLRVENYMAFCASFPEDIRHEYGISPVSEPDAGTYDGIVIAVAHDAFTSMGGDAIRALGKPGALLYDIKGVLAKSESDLRL